MIGFPLVYLFYSHIRVGIFSPKCDNKVLFAMLPEKFLIRVCSSPILDVTDRLNLMLTCKQLRMAASKSWSLVTKLRIANNESDDDRIDDRLMSF